MMYPQFPGNPYPYPYMPQQSMMYPMGMMGMKPSLLQSMKYSLNQLSMSSTIRTAQKTLYTANQIITSAKKYNCINIDRNIYQFIYKDRIIEDISKAFNINLDKKYEKREKIKKLLKY